MNLNQNGDVELSTKKIISVTKYVVPDLKVRPILTIKIIKFKAKSNHKVFHVNVILSAL
jgi:hypothetical protein